jgi:hypothetical protein
MNFNFAEGLDHFRQTLSTPPGAPQAPDELIGAGVGALLQDLAAARAGGLFYPLPEEAPGQTHHPSRIRAIRSRLAGLGYLRHDAGLAVIDPLLIRAIRHFQQDAGLTADGWVGRQTWQALQELAGFERQGAILRWITEANARPALQRAVALRLQTLGLTDTPAFADPARLVAGLYRLRAVASFLQPQAPLLPPEIHPETVALLFDQELLVENLAALPAPVPLADDHPLVAFAACAARVELWLAGYEVTPDGPGSRPSADGDSPLAAALATYWRDHGRDREALSADRFARQFPAFFRMIAAAIRTGRNLNAAERAAAVYQTVAGQPDRLESVWQTAHGLGGQMWDGMDRVCGWLLHLQRQPGAKTVSIGRNVARLVYQQAMAAHDAVHRALLNFPALLAAIFQRQWPGSDPAHIVMRHDLDLDFRVYVNPAGDREKITRFIDEVERTSASFGDACRLIAAFLRTLRAGIGAGRTGWAGLILALLQLVVTPSPSRPPP